ncbi:MAG: GNAT family N-acetyltransferase [Paracoccaceae bacterium]
MIQIRDLHGMAEFRLAQELQYAVWGKDDLADPADLMMVIEAEGGIAAGAFQEGRLLGYVFGFATRTPHIQHSHRLAVLPQTQGMGLGLRLKWYQRDWCLARGITHVRWTYDPLRSANAGLNIARLGAQARTYYPDYYGEMEGINRGAPSDRLLADWYLDSAQVTALATGQTPVPPSHPDTLRLAIPADFGAMLTANPTAALAARLTLRTQMQDAFAKGYAVRGYDTARREYILLPD